MPAHKMFANGRFTPPRRHSEATIQKRKKAARKQAKQNQILCRRVMCRGCDSGTADITSFSAAAMSTSLSLFQFLQVSNNLFHSLAQIPYLVFRLATY